MKKRKICVLGLGYIGLPTSALLANRGYEIHGVDVMQSVVDIINQGKIHIVEPELDIFVKAAVNSGKLKADTKPDFADIFVIAVPTPFHDGFVPNIDYVLSAAKAITTYIQEGNIIILESTSPVGTTQKIENILKEHGVDTTKIFIAHCPERVLPGHIMRELVQNDRIVGGTTAEATKVTAEFYREFVQGEVFETDDKTAEMAKLTENSFRDTNIAFANELSILCDQFDINVWELIALANRHPRVNILQPGCGVGGHCIAVDPWFIVHAGGESAKLIRTAREVNNYKSEWVIEKIKNVALVFENENGRKAKVACMGLAFKPDIDDLRESPALYITRRLIADGLDILAVEPNIEAFKEFEIVDYKEALEKADIVTFLVAHKEFKNLDVQTKLDFCGVSHK
ncbi:UDP-N-acetyl-D-mannosaminuronic acid dehydrogenase [Sulfurovum sp. enrichment culture clone C5]|uniref:UDP-N-acetyl-D-mannosaminuronic acid dehydrogenase n=1 Tax=Sulfurovum sp. enrichment culture clone C5 TaxID=497650 RepID=A0A0S4XQD3_9BACT|nr:UDP-N-acetyl-D-mannosaminuronic acid dehydrogenase [Sulfurovum sp. enrichment culture clone C5]